ncbi:MAG: Ig-like domain-containing protein [Leptolyngbyaceae cyanobacterium bins.349]|nr:Ig-like domain-containing protein [Leptolyngbyaceae cyanobacterium bins.349]
MTIAAAGLEQPWPQMGRATSAGSAIAFIDSSVLDYQHLAGAIAPGTAIYVLDPLQDAVSQITQTLLQSNDVTSVHLISHGSAGRLQLGNTRLDSTSLGGYAQQLQSWSQVLTPDADILLYGCEVGAEGLGTAFLQQLAQLTGADIAASTDLTGNASLGGDWELEVQTGDIAAALIFDATARNAYGFILPSQVVSMNGSTQGNGDSWTVNTGSGNWNRDAATSVRQTISDDGRYVLFTSQSTNLATGDPNGVQEDIFLRDRILGTTLLVSAQYNSGTGDNSTNIAGQGRSLNPVMSADGRYVAFTSNAANLVATDANGSTRDVFLWDRDTRRTTLISRGNSGQEGWGDAFGPSISRDGKRVVFTSSGNLFRGSGPDDYYHQVVLYEWTTTPTAGSIRQVSVNNVGQSGNEQSGFEYPALISGNGQYVVFQSNATNLIDLNNDNIPDGELNGGSDVFVRDLATNRTILVSVNSSGTGSGNQGAGRPSISEDGQTIAFISNASNLVSGGTNGSRHAFVRNLATGTTQLVSVSSTGQQAYPWEATPNVVLSGDGRFAVFANGSDNLVTGDNNNARDLFLRDLTANTTTLVSVNQGNTGAGNGASNSQDDMFPAISFDGRYLVFSSLATDLVSNDANGVSDVFLRDRVAGTTTLISRNQAGTGSGNGTSDFATINRSGNVIAFSSTASNLVTTDTNGRMDAFVFTAGNQPPIAASDSFGTNEDTLLTNTVLTNDSDPDNNTPLTVSLLAGTANGSLSLNANGTFNYTPNANFSGTDTFTYSVRDSLGANSGLASVVLSVTATNDAPIAVNDQYTLIAGSPFTVSAAGVLANDTDIDTPAANFTANVVGTPTNGTLVLNPNGSFSYTPNAGFTGSDRFTYRVNDGSANSGLATVSLSVTAAINQPPVAANDSATGNEDTGLTGDVLTNDSDPDGNTPLTATLVTAPSFGSLSLNANGRFSYTPTANYNGTDTFTYVTRDALGADSNTATVVLTVNAVNDTPSFTVGANQSVMAGAGAQTVTNWATGFNPGAANESTQAIAAYDIVNNSNPSIFTTAPSISAAGTLTYTPVSSIAGTASAVIAARVRDNGGTANGGTDISPTQFFTITVTGQPSLNIANVSQAEGNSGNTSHRFTVTLSSASSQTVSVNYATADGTATVADGDYVADSGTLIFLPGETSKVIPIAVRGDTRLEANETFRVNLSTATNAQIGQGNGTATIVNDDLQPTLQVQGGSRQEGNSGVNNLLFTVTLSNASQQTVSVGYTTTDGTATHADGDYINTTGTLIFAPGETSKTVVVGINGDRKSEANETFALTLRNPVNSTITAGSAIGTILNDESATASDFNQDGIDDIVWRNYVTGENQIWLMGSTLPMSVVSLPSASLEWVLEGVGDFNQDGSPDLLWREYGSGLTGFWTMSRTNVQAWIPLAVVDTNWQIEGVGDLNGDGNPDIVWRDVNSGYLAAWRMNGMTAISFDYLSNVAMDWSLESIADINNDGRLDFIWRNPSQNATLAWLMYGGLGAPFFSATSYVAPTGSQWDVADTSDYNRDGKTDVMWRNHNTGENIIWLMDGGRLIGQISTFSLLWGWFGVG